jgi:hypothetical protein
MTLNFQTDLKTLDDLMKNFLNHLIDQIIKINVQSIQIIQTEQK